VTADASQPPNGAAAILGWITAAVAILGGVITLAIAVTVTASVVGRNLLDQGIPGDFEYVQMGTAIAVFAFLPFCQLRRGNIIVDTFSAHWPPRLRILVDALWDVVYAAIMGLLAFCLFRGALDIKANGTATMVMGTPVWPAVLACALLCGLLSLVCLLTATRLLAGKP
jgi:TRAP-type C4-dicarboxylate transport system permease small subunit